MHVYESRHAFTETSLAKPYMKMHIIVSQSSQNIHMFACMNPSQVHWDESNEIVHEEVRHCSEIVYCQNREDVWFKVQNFLSASAWDIVVTRMVPDTMRCDVCPSYFTAEQCTEFQRIHGCHACDRRNCWRANPVCLFFSFKSREPHSDAAWGDTVPHMRETHITCTGWWVTLSRASSPRLMGPISWRMLQHQRERAFRHGQSIWRSV